MNRIEKSDVKWMAIGGVIVFVFCLLVGILDQYKLLDPILDFLHIPQ